MVTTEPEERTTKEQPGHVCRGQQDASSVAVQSAWRCPEGDARRSACSAWRCPEGDARGRRAVTNRRQSQVDVRKWKAPRPLLKMQAEEDERMDQRSDVTKRPSQAGRWTRGCRCPGEKSNDDAATSLTGPKMSLVRGPWGTTRYRNSVQRRSLVIGTKDVRSSPDAVPRRKDTSPVDMLLCCSVVFEEEDITCQEQSQRRPKCRIQLAAASGGVLKEESVAADIQGMALKI